MQENVLRPTQWLSTAFGKIPRRIKITFVMGMTAFLLIHFYGMTRKFYNHDDAYSLLSDGGLGIQLGRWLLPYVANLSTRLSMPWVNGLLSAVYLSVGACAVVTVTDMRSPVCWGLTALLLSAFPVTSSTMLYTFTVDPYFFSIMLACVSVAVTKRFRFGWLAGGLLMAGSLGLYQAYFGVACSLSIIALIVQTLREDRRPDEVIFEGIRYVLSLALGLLLYFLILRGMLWLTGMEMTGYQGISATANLDFTQLPEYIHNAYGVFFSFFHGLVYRFSPGWMRWVYLALAVAAAGCALVRALQWKKGPLAIRIGRGVLLLVLLGLFPLGCMIIWVMAPGSWIHSLLVYPFAFAPVLAVAMLGETKIPLSWHKALRAGMGAVCIAGLLLSAVTGYVYATVCNQVYFKMEMNRHQMDSYFTRLTTRMEEHPAYTPGMRVAFIGFGKNGLHPEGLDHLAVLTEAALTKEDVIEAVVGVNVYSRRAILRDYFGMDIVEPRPELKAALLASEEVMAMPLYPAEGSIALVEDVLVVKLSNDWSVN